MSQHRIHKPKVARAHILILSEDSAGIATYLRQSFPYRQGDSVNVSVEGKGYQPENLYKCAKDALKSKRADLVFLVFDKDRAPKFECTVRKCAAENRIFAFATIPCFEFFFLLHFGLTTAPYSCYTDLEGALRALQPFRNYSKKKNAVPISALSKLQPIAFANAGATRTHRHQTGSLNPYTDLDLLFKYVAIAKSNGIDQVIALPHTEFLTLG